MKKKINLVLILVLAIMLVTGCQKKPVKKTDTFTSTYQLSGADKGRSIIVSGNKDGSPGEQSQYMLNINNNGEPWNDDFYVELVDSDAIVQEITHAKLDILANGGMQQPLTVKFPSGFKGTLGLCVVIPKHAYTISALSVGENTEIAPKLFDLSYLYQPKE
jgi:hypothetical protein